MASHEQPFLLNTSTTTKFNSKTLVLVLSVCAILFSTLFITQVITLRHTGPSTPLDFCNRAHDPQECLLMVSEAVSNGVQESNGIHLLQTFLAKSVSEMRLAIQTAREENSKVNDHRDQAALADCMELMDMSIDRVTTTLEALASGRTRRVYADAHTWLSGVLTNHVTCSDGINTSSLPAMKVLLHRLISRARISLAAAASMSPSDSTDIFQPLNGRLPRWFLVRDLRLLKRGASNVEANVVVAQDGSGNFKTVQEAVDSAPDKGKTRYVIHVKQGIYVENVEIGKKKKNVMIVGDGMDSTIITGSLNVADGSTTFRSATLAVTGDGFILQDVGVQNTAGPEKHQAVALRVSADQCVINRCRIDAYQDTLYAHSYRQFYRDCYITGTIDFIFGNAAVVIQNSWIAARKPMEHQKNMVTAQGRIDPNQNTGTSIQCCDIVASTDLEPVQDQFPTYLGRPWKEYSRTVFMQSYLDAHIHPAGWAEWNKDFALNTLYYGEFANRGPGAGVSNRVNWTGYHVITDPNEARQFTVAQMIQGGEWLGATGVSYTEGL
ncbi:hypothetical protein Tsubulata_005483 [Turnera subulata]|uniref:Pectinesterase n=1 Tax=Turnera subulata TaxID=218843 RepID=A0A9Q0FS26_9ROSI|nr:hypothetical protein Tsubulata_005483 [Turnera subulata]